MSMHRFTRSMPCKDQQCVERSVQVDRAVIGDGMPGNAALGQWGYGRDHYRGPTCLMDGRQAKRSIIQAAS